MAWRDELRRVVLSDGRRLIGASFRGIPFFVATAERSGGRRIVTHEFPLRDDPYIEDLGRRARVFPVEGYILGDDYLAQRDALLEALEDTAGPGELVHPYYGVKRAICSNLTERETIADGGMAMFQIEFTEAPVQSVAPTEQTDPVSATEESASAAQAAVTEELETNYITEGQPSYALASLTDALSGAGDAMRDKLGALTLGEQEAARLSAEVRRFSLEAASLIETPTDIMTELGESIDALIEAVADAPRPALLALQALAEEIEPAPVFGTTPARVQEAANQTALAAALRATFTCAAARLLILVEYETLEDAVADRDAIADLLDDLAATVDDTSYGPLVQLRADIVSRVPGDAVLARLVTTERRVALPSLLLSYILYGSVDKADAIVARNRAPHPGFLSGSLQVLSDG